MTTYAGFIAAICAEPTDDAIRLIYADFLSDNGEPEYGDFIRVGCRKEQLLRQVQEWASLSSAEPGGSQEAGGKAGAALAEAQSLERREHELLTAWKFWEWFGDTFTAAWPGSPSAQVKGRDVCITYAQPDDDRQWYVVVYHGFIAEITCPLADWLAYGPSLVRQQPIERVTLSDKEPHEGPLHDERYWRNGKYWQDRQASAVLPEQVFNLLKGGTLYGMAHQEDVSRGYPTRQAALDAVSQALLRLARARE